MEPSRERLHDLLVGSAGAEIERQRIVDLIRARLQELQGEPSTRDRSQELKLILNRINETN
jgi:hypothetical protein